MSKQQTAGAGQTNLATQRREAVADAVNKVREIDERGVNRENLAQIQQVLQALAARTDLFPLADFPPLPAGSERNNALYRLSEDDDHRFALYAQMSSGGTDTPAHNHTTWAVIVGLQGDELNRLYERTDDGGVRQTGEHLVTSGTGISFMPDDLHSIHISGKEPVLNFHMYGLALEQLHKREYYNEKTRSWSHFPASSGIRDMPQ